MDKTFFKKFVFLTGFSLMLLMAGDAKALTVTSITPPSMNFQSAPLNGITINGTQFEAGLIVYFNDINHVLSQISLPANFNSTTVITLTASELNTLPVGTFIVIVGSPTKGIYSPPSVNFTVTDSPTPPPVNPYLTVNKILSPSTNTGKFNLQINGTTYASDVGDGGTTGQHQFIPGSYTIGEAAGAGTNLNDYTSVIGGVCDTNGNVSLQYGDNKTCTITNTYIPTYTLSVNSSGVQGVTINSSNNNAWGGTTNYQKPNITSGILVSLSAPAAFGGFNFSNWVGCDSINTTTCSLTMNAIRGVTAVYVAPPPPPPPNPVTIVVKKIMVNGTATFTFTGNLNGTISANNGILSLSVLPGTYSSTENATMANWNLNSISCNNPSGVGSNLASGTGNIPTGTATFTVPVNPAAGQTLTCTFTNTYNPPPPPNGYLAISKTVTGGSGTFNFFVIPTPGVVSVTGGGSNTVALAPGNYSVSETVPTNWTLTGSGCSNGSASSFTITSGQTTSCTFTNTYNPPPPTANTGSITIVKSTTGGGPGGNFVFSSTSNIINGNGWFSPSTLTVPAGNNTVSRTISNLVKGTYTIGEFSMPSGYSKNLAYCHNDTSISAFDPSSIFFDPATGNVVCNFFNAYAGTPVTYTLNVTSLGTYSGVFITSSSSNGVDYGGTTNSTDYPKYNIPAGTQINLTAPLTTQGNLNQVNWTGCDSVINQIICKITMNATRTVVADYRSNTNPNPPPTITSISPTSKLPCDSNTILTVNGNGFIPDPNGSKIHFGFLEVPTTTYVSPTQLTTDISQTAVGTYSVTVVNPAPGGGTSNLAQFDVVAQSSANPPTIASIDPASVTAGDPAFTMTIIGTNFRFDSILKFNGFVRTYALVSDSRITKDILASEIAKAVVWNITVTNPATSYQCQALTSSPARFTVNALSPPPPLPDRTTTNDYPVSFPGVSEP